MEAEEGIDGREEEEEWGNRGTKRKREKDGGRRRE